MGLPKIEDGKTSYHQYKLLKPAFAPVPADAVYIDGDPFIPVESVESLIYKVSDGSNDLVAWTQLSPDVEGIIEIPGHINRVSGNNRKRILTLFAIHDGGKHLPTEIQYSLIDYVGITPDTEPKTQS